MHVLRTLGAGGLKGLGILGETQPSGYCLINNAWIWTTADQCPRPLSPGGAPKTQAGFCWIRQDPPNAFPGYWVRGGDTCVFEGPPTPPSEIWGWCQAADGQWQWKPASQCSGPVRDERPSDGGVVTRDHRLDPVDRSVLDQRLYAVKYRSAVRRDAITAAMINGGQLKPCKDVMGVRADRSCELQTKRGNLSLLDPIGVIMELGVAFSPQELATAGKLERVYSPDREQRFIADYQIYAQSQRLLAGILGNKIISMGLSLGTDPDAIRKTVATYRSFAMPDNSDIWLSDLFREQMLVRRDGPLIGAVETTKLSVDQALDLFDFFLTSADFSLTPIAPTAQERTSEWGLRDFYRRGGFIISRKVSSGQDPVIRASLTWNTGYCACSNGQVYPTFGRATGEGYGWDLFLTIGPQYTMAIRPHDAPWWSEAATFAAGILKDLAGFICGNRPLVKALNEQLASELCQDVQGKPCTKGAAGCYCIPPTTTQQGAVAVANAGLEVWCGRAADWLKPKETPLNPPPPPQDPLSWKTLLPWTLGGLIAGAVGAFWAKKG